MEIVCQVNGPTGPGVLDGNVSCDFSQDLNETKHDVCVYRYAVGDTNLREPGLVICCRWLSETDFRCSDGNGKHFESTISDKFVYHMQNITEGRYVCDVNPQETGNQNTCIYKGSATSTTTSMTTFFTSSGNTTALPEEGLSNWLVAVIVIVALLVCAVVIILVLRWKIRKCKSKRRGKSTESHSAIRSNDDAEESKQMNTEHNVSCADSSCSTRKEDTGSQEASAEEKLAEHA